jgi:uncharacterized protein YkwD
METRYSLRSTISCALAIFVIAAACSPPTAPASLTISAQPQGQTIASGATATLTVAGAGASPIEYQWYVGTKGTTTAPIGGATAANYTTPALTSSTSYWVRVSSSSAAIDSETATITVVGPAGTAPAIASQPQSQTIASGATATLAVDATGTTPLAFQWYSGSSGTTAAPIPGATASTYTTAVLTATASYWVRVTNAHGSADSATAVVTVTAAPPPPPPDPASPLEDAVLVLVNQRRAAGATCGGTVYGPAPALYMHPNLRVAARGHSQDMAAQNYFSHTSLDGRTFDQRIRNAGYTGSSPLGENIAAGYPTAQAVVDGWMGSPGHCANIMSPGFRAVGVGYAHNPASIYRHYWTQNFGGS